MRNGGLASSAFRRTLSNLITPEVSTSTRTYCANAAKGVAEAGSAGAATHAAGAKQVTSPRVRKETRLALRILPLSTFIPGRPSDALFVPSLAPIFSARSS